MPHSKIAFILIKILLVFVIYACTNQTDTNKLLRIKAIKTIRLQIDSLSKNHFDVLQFLEKTNELIFLNKKINALDLYDLSDNNKLKNRILLKKEGENGVGTVNNFLFHTADSIFLLNSYAYKVFLINNKAQVINTYSLIKGQIGNQTALPFSMPFHNPMVLKNNKLYISATPDRNPNTKDYFNAKMLSICLDLKSKKYTYDYSYPINYKKKFYPNAYHLFSRIYNENKDIFVYSFFASDSLYITNYKNFQRVVNGSGARFNQVVSFEKPILNNIENNSIANSNSFYSNLFFNKWKNIYYRFCVIQNEQIKEQEIDILVFNENFEKLGFVSLKKSQQYNPLNIFFTPEGMWIQRFTNNEDELVYDLVEFVAE